MERDPSLHGADARKAHVATMCAMFDHAVETAPNNVALRHFGAALTYRELGRAVAALASGLATMVAPGEVVASGGALLRSPAWTQMMADALGRPVIACLENEASGRGAALLALERLQVIRHVREVPAGTGKVFEPVEPHRRAYEEELERQHRLYAKLFEENGTD